MSYTGILMIKIKKSALRQTLSSFIFCTALLTQSQAFAEIDLTGMYAGVIFSNNGYDLKTNSGKVSESWGHVKAKVGTSLTELIDAEGQLGLTTNSDAGHGVVSYGAYLRIGKDMGQYKPYGLVGLSGFYLYEDGYDSESETGFSYGAGIEIFGSKDLTVTFEYLRLIDKSVDGGDLTFDTLGVGFTYYFTEDTSYFNKNRNKIRSIRY